jgi:hypothetical protein
MSVPDDKMDPAEKHSGEAGSKGRPAGRGRAAKAAAVVLPVAIVAIGAWILLGTHGARRSPAPHAASVAPANRSEPAQGTAGDATAGAPKIEFPEASYDFGAVIQGAEVTHTFSVRNAGSEPLKLIDAGAS